MKKLKQLIWSGKRYLSRQWESYVQFKCLDNPTGSAGEPVFIYQMGKVASSSIYESLKEQGLCVFHAHVLNFPKDKAIPRGFEWSIKEGKRLRSRLIDRGIPLKIITLTRDPIARNISAYFQNLDAIHQERDVHEKVSIEGLISTFLAEYDHAIPLTWFERELRDVTGINVYDHEFPKDKGFQVIERGTIRALIMQVELTNDVKLRLIREFIGHPGFSLKERNIASAKHYSAQYKEFVRRIKLPQEYVERLLESKYARHFYSDSDRARFREKWLREA